MLPLHERNEKTRMPFYYGEFFLCFIREELD
jgi:hypothetical protein